VQLHAPTLDDVFLEKTGRTLEGAGAEAPAPEQEEEVGVVARSSPFAMGATSVMVKEWLQEGRAHLTGVRPAPGLPTLVVREGPLAGRRFTIAEQAVVGREGVDVLIEDPEISRRHALLRIVDGFLVVEDLRSLNGTWVNGKRITTATLLSPGDTVELGKTVIDVHAQGVEAGAPA
jgi:hypothetical protein